MNDVRSMNHAGRNELTQEFNLLAEHAERLLNATATMSGEGIAAAREGLVQSIASVRDNIGSANRYARERARQAVANADSYVREKPWQSVAVGFVAGLVLGMVARMRTA